MSYLNIHYRICCLYIVRIKVAAWQAREKYIGREDKGGAEGIKTRMSVSLTRVTRAP